MLRRVVVPLLLLPAIALAQAPRHNDIGIWSNHTSYRSTSGAEPFSAVQVSLDSRPGYGVSLTHFLGQKVSVALSADQLRGRARLAQNDLGLTLDAGPSRLRAFAAVAQWHFTPPWIFDLYAGGGAAYMSGGRMDVPAAATEEHVAGTIAFKNAVAPVLNAGASLQVSRRVSGAVDVKRMGYRPRLHTTPDDPFQSLRLNPLTIALGLRVHM